MINAHDLACRIHADAVRYHIAMGALPIITMSSGARKLLEEDPETNGLFYESCGFRCFCGFAVSTDPSDKVWYRISRRVLFKEDEQ